MAQIVLDMDGTFVDLYKVNGWLDDLKAERTRPYEEAEPMYDMDDFNAIINMLRENGHKVIIVSWGSKTATKEYNRRIRKAKVEWLNRHGVVVDEIHVVKYGTPKSYMVKGEATLFDDEEQNRRKWLRGDTVDATQNILEILKAYV